MNFTHPAMAAVRPVSSSPHSWPWWPRIALVRAVHVFCKEKTMSNSDKVWPTGLTQAESEEIHRNL
ncbi:MAG: hypothetical protein ACK5EL_13175, partial [Limnohabitans sp.]